MMRTSIARALLLLAAAGLAELRATAEADDQMIGQMIMVGFSGEDEHDPGVMAVRDQLAKGVIGGVALYTENITSARQLRLLTAFLANANSKLVPFIAVDQEGGMVQRLTPHTGHTHYPSARKIGREAKLGTVDTAHHLYEAMAKELAAAGINLNSVPWSIAVSTLETRSSPAANGASAPI